MESSDEESDGEETPEAPEAPEADDFHGDVQHVPYGNDGAEARNDEVCNLDVFAVNDANVVSVHEGTNYERGLSYARLRGQLYFENGHGVQVAKWAGVYAKGQFIYN